MTKRLTRSGAPCGHVHRVERRRGGPLWYVKYRLPDGRQVQRVLGPAWTQRGESRRTPPATLELRVSHPIESTRCNAAVVSICTERRSAQCRTRAQDACELRGTECFVADLLMVTASWRHSSWPRSPCSRSPRRWGSRRATSSGRPAGGARPGALIPRERRTRRGLVALRPAAPALAALAGVRAVDLQVTAVKTIGAGAAPGRTFTVSAQVKRVNHRPKVRLQLVLTAFLASRAAVTAREHVSGGSASLTLSAAGTAPARRFPFVVPIGTTAGYYYVVVCVTVLGRYRDTDKQHECRVSSKRIVVQPSAGGVSASSTVVTASSSGAAATQTTAAASSSSSASSQTPPATQSSTSTSTVMTTVTTTSTSSQMGGAPPAYTPVPVAITPPSPGPTDGAAANPDNVAPPLSDTGTTDFLESVSFLFTGTDPIQQGVASGTVQESTAALVQGNVTNTSGTALGGVRISVLGHPELGFTDTATNGSFSMAVNASGPLTLVYDDAGYIPIQGNVTPMAGAATEAPTVALSAYAAQADDINLESDAPIQVAQGPVDTDASGSRQATLMFSAGTTATMQLADGSTQPLTDLHVRASEFTVGSLGPEAMPGSLPGTSAYTYASAFTIDEAVAAGATSVTFSKPVIAYVNDFLGLPVGAAVPSGSYDPSTGAWGASNDGVVIKVLSTAGGTATLDVTGSGSAATPAQLSALGITPDELQAIAANFQAGDTLWRVPLMHFSSWDFNFLPSEEQPALPPTPGTDTPPTDESCDAPAGPPSCATAARWPRTSRWPAPATRSTIRATA